MKSLPPKARKLLKEMGRKKKPKPPPKIDPPLCEKTMKFLIQKSIKFLIVSGKKEKAEKIFLKSLHIIKILEKKEGIFFLLKALKNLKPTLELRSVRRGGATYQVPIPLRERRSISLALKWLIDSARKKKSNLSLNLAQVIIEASKNLGENIKKRRSLDSAGLNNRGFATLLNF